jgi:hypothetical protein
MSKSSKLVCKNAGISLPYETLRLIDEARGDVSRSRYVLRALERALIENEKSARVRSPDNKPY